MHPPLRAHTARDRKFRLTRFAAALAVSSGFVVPAGAADRDWFGGTGDWALDSNWSPSGVPGSGDHAIVGAGNAGLSFAQVVGALTQQGGTISGEGLTISGNAIFAGGTQTGPGTTQFNGAVLIGGDGSRQLSGARIMNTAAVTTWSGNTAHGGNRFDFNGSGTINNSGTWNDANAFDSSIGAGNSGTKAFNNTGTYNKSGNSTTTVTTAFSNSGTLNVDAGGVFRVTAADFRNSGTLQGNGTVGTAVNGELMNSGVIAPGTSTGMLTIDGGLMMTSDGEIRIELTSLSDFDRLSITGDVAFDGTLAVFSLGYAPVVGDSFTIVFFDERLANSEFAAVDWNGFGSGVNFDVAYNMNDVTLTVTAVPEPSTYILSLLGLGIVAAMVRRRRARRSR